MLGITGLGKGKEVEHQERLNREIDHSQSTDECSAVQGKEKEVEHQERLNREIARLSRDWREEIFEAEELPEGVEAAGRPNARTVPPTTENLLKASALYEATYLEAAKVEEHSWRRYALRSFPWRVAPVLLAVLKGTAADRRQRAQPGQSAAA